VFDQLLTAFGTALHPTGLAFLAAGVIAGIFLGAMPGLGPTMGMAIALPFVIRLEPEYGIFLFTAIIIGAGFGNALPAVLVGIPGTPSALLTVEAGLPFGRRGEGGRALLVSLFGATFGQFCGVLAFAFLISPVVALSSKFLFPEFFALEVLGMTAAAALMGSSVSKGMAAVLIGCLIALVGPDPVTGQPRLTFGVDALEGGVETVPALIGLLALREIFLSPATPPVSTADARRRAIRLPRINLTDLKESTGPAVVGTGVGLVIGALPGAGPTTASFISYRLVSVVRRWRRPRGEGSLPAIAATDASQNASGTSGLIPTFALGIPGDPADVLILAALTTQGLIVGPNLAQSSPGLLGVVAAGLLISSILMVVLGYLSIWPSSFFAAAPQRVITYATLVAVMTGVYAYRQSLVDVWVTLGAGLLGFAMGKIGMPVAPAALALVLGSAAESDLRRGLIMTDGFAGFVSRPVTLTILIVVVLLLLAGPARAAVRLARGRSRSDDETRRSEHV
jgi:putative tricarboxylic transport membrane protein